MNARVASAMEYIFFNVFQLEKYASFDAGNVDRRTIDGTVTWCLTATQNNCGAENLELCIMRPISNDYSIFNSCSLCSLECIDADHLIQTRQVIKS